MNFKIKVTGDASLPNIQAKIKGIRDSLMSEVRLQVASRTPILTGQARRGWQQRGKTQVTNEVPYIGRLENGYSRQAPNGFVIQGTKAAIEATIKKVK
jgi:hypothetical protein